MRVFILILSYILLQLQSFSQSDLLKKDDQLINSGCIEIPPKYPGGEAAMKKFITLNMRLSKINSEGKVIIQYTVDTLGRTTDITIYKGVCNELDKEAIWFTSLLKGWAPATRNGKKINWIQRQPYVFVFKRSN